MSVRTLWLSVTPSKVQHIHMHFFVLVNHLNWFVNVNIFHVNVLSAVCLASGTATGTVPTSVLSYSDYISRPEEQASILRFDKDEMEKQCRVVIIDDSLYEGEESFNLTLSMPVGGRLGGEHHTTRVHILPDLDDGKDIF